jgi:Na+-driven multidrug efflux pump
VCPCVSWLSFQAVFSVWNLLAFTTAPLEQAALAYLPSATTRLQQQATVQVLLLFATCIGIGCGLLAAGVPLLAPQLLTRDPAVWVHMSSVAPMALLAMLLTAADVGATGILLARRDLSYVARAYLVTLSALAVYVVAGVHGCGWGLPGVWYGLVLFFGLRCVQSLGRLYLQGLAGHPAHGMPAPAEG